MSDANPFAPPGSEVRDASDPFGGRALIRPSTADLALKLTNALLAFVLVLLGAVWLLKGRPSVGGMVCLALPLAACVTAALAFHTLQSRFLRTAWWLNILLLAIFVLVDVLALFALKVTPDHPAVIALFQLVLVFAPTLANIHGIRRVRRAAQ